MVATVPCELGPPGDVATGCCVFKLLGKEGSGLEQVYYPWQEIMNSVPKSTALDEAWPRLLSTKIIAMYEYFISLS